ncbi:MULTISPECIES: hypothetical protein [Acinetobacter]|uniref:Uncharacterized protein n=6 Tax=Acinetobacter baumannii TaxID=470 RepID=A0A0D5YIA7_ACIBA|nr:MULTISPECIES: hypothetical protein [Acinetobacter]EMT96112.1 hypothetical protein ABNIH6_08867 [Acinetobacter baumannii ABNIH6]EMU05540.1 hypothetical protein ABNIH10_13272 [Acinetobacter baumannii ABNIH10]PXA51986.1 hypothetical protein DMB35_09340 [Acinetobacter baumannii A424]ACJ41122.1 hypothetical protein AB57_1740 [Acinetobacter baumannii AB0057]AJF81555.1 hypothetical protein ABA1_01659 [Acinetobacter baumannii]
MNLDFTTIEKQAKLLKEEQEKIEQQDHDFQLALDKHRESLKNLFKELFHDREIKTENGGQFCVVFGDFKISLLIETAKFENGVPVKLNSVNPIIVKFKKDKPVAKAQFSDATQYLDSGFETPHYQYYYKHADKTQLVQFSELPVFFQAILDAEV